MQAYALDRSAAAFESSVEEFGRTVSWLGGSEAAAMTHGEVESHLEERGRELLRQMFQDHLDVRAQREVRRVEVTGADGVARRSVEEGHGRGLRTVFGEVEAKRLAYRQRGHSNLHPADVGLNLPAERHSHGLRRLAAIESARGSFEEAVGAIERSTGQHLGKRQVELLAQRAAQDFEAFYQERPRSLSALGDLLTLTCDGKGIVMRTESLREGTRKAAESKTTKLKTRLSRGEKSNRKRMAEVGAVYDCTPVSRGAFDILARSPQEKERAIEGPRARSKWLTASVVQDAREVIAALFDEALRRDPDRRRPWLVLVDGLNHQIECIEAEAAKRGVHVPILVDFIHVLEYLWKAAWCFFEEGDPEAEDWVHRHAFTILQGRSSDVAGAIRRKATCLELPQEQRANANKCANYLIAKRPYLDYPTALERGWPIATGVIEGACRHLVKDRMDITGARWGLDGAEAVLKLRALRTNGDFDDYWRFHLNREQQRVHLSRYETKPTPTPS